MNVSPEVVAMIAQLVAIVGGFLKLEGRLTKLETTQNLMLQGMIKNKALERRENDTGEH